MFNLIMKGRLWETDVDTFDRSRIFEHTENHITAEFKTGDAPDLDKLARLPCIFMQEGTGSQIARVCRVTNIRQDRYEVRLEYVPEPGMPTLTNRDIYNAKGDFGITSDFEFSRTHWAVKDVDIYKALLRLGSKVARSKPSVFRVTDRENVDPALLSVMMPFDAGFRPVYDSIKGMAAQIGMQCHRVDDIWINNAIIQDVVDLIDKSRVVICDCTGRNANVFYEAGIAHTLGRDVILITQNGEDIPFDLRHIRYIRYLDNPQGREGLCDTLRARIDTLML